MGCVNKEIRVGDESYDILIRYLTKRRKNRLAINTITISALRFIILYNS